MTILHVTDLHFTERWFAWLQESAPPHDLLCISGDLLDQRRDIPYARQAALVAEWLSLHPRPVCMCSGSSDLAYQPPGRPRRPADWLRTLGGPRLFGDGTTAVFFGQRLEVVGYRELPRTAAEVWLTHLPPAGLPIARSEQGVDVGDPALADSVRLQRPQLVLAGHVHHPEAWFHEENGTVFLNPGCARGSRIPNHILIEPGIFSATRVTEGPLGAYSESVIRPPVTTAERLSA